MTTSTSLQVSPRRRHLAEMNRQERVPRRSPASQMRWRRLRDPAAHPCAAAWLM
jgi:hypothetical protein